MLANLTGPVPAVTFPLPNASPAQIPTLLALNVRSDSIASPPALAFKSAGPSFIPRSKRARRHRFGVRPQAVYTGVFPNPGGSNVKVVHVDKSKAKRVLAEVTVHASVKEVWSVLTDYSKLTEYVPNLDVCERLKGGTKTRYRLRQAGCSQSLFLRLEASAVLDVQEVEGTMGRRELRFSMIESENFKEFSGKWVVEPDPTVRDGRSLGATKLRYEISVVPRWPIPSSVVSHLVKAGLPANITAIAQRAEEMARKRTEAPRFIAGSLNDDSVLGRLPYAEHRGIRGEVLPAKGPARAPWPTLSLQAPSIDWKGAQAGRFGPGGYLGVTSVPLPGSSTVQSDSAADRRQREQSVQASYPAIRPNNQKSLLEALTEVHLRRLDTADVLHRRAVATIAIEATPEEVWQVLTDYEALPEFVPNLALCERLPLSRDKASRMVRLRQVGFKDMLFMQLHAEAVLDLSERPCQEIQFRAVAGDFMMLRGKFLLSEPQLEGRPAMLQRKETHLKYAVEVQIPRATPMMGMLELVMERVVYEDIPFNLAAVKQRVEEQKLQRRITELEDQGEFNRAELLRRRVERPRLSDMAEDFGVLAAELERCFGGTGTMPTRAQLRAVLRSDLEKAIAAHGGPKAVSKKLGWRLAYQGRKPNGYWDRLANVQKEIDMFCTEHDLPKGIVPSLAEFRRANRFDLKHAVERWGGLREVADLLEYEVLTFRGDNDWSQHVAETAAETGLSGTNGLFEVASKTYREKIRQSQMSMDEADYVSSSDDEGATAQQSANDTQRVKSRNLRRSNSIAAEQAGGLSNGAATSSSQKSGTGNGNGRQQNLSSREAVQQAVLKQQQASQKPSAGTEPAPKAGIRRGRGSVPAVPKQGKPASGLDRDLRDEIDAW